MNLMNNATMTALAYELVRCLLGVSGGSVHDFGFRVWHHAQKLGLIDAECNVIAK